MIQPSLSTRVGRQVVFVHSGGSSGGFDVTVSDGVKTTSPLRFVARVRPVTLRRAFLTPLHAFPLRRQCLSIAQLLFAAADRRPVTFHVTRAPALGALLLEGRPRPRQSARMDALSLRGYSPEIT